jgi:hypothetical protein
MKVQVTNAYSIKLLPENDSDKALIDFWSYRDAKQVGGVMSADDDGKVQFLRINFYYLKQHECDS